LGSAALGKVCVVSECILYIDRTEETNLNLAQKPTVVSLTTAGGYQEIAVPKRIMQRRALIGA